MADDAKRDADLRGKILETLVSPPKLGYRVERGSLVAADPKAQEKMTQFTHELLSTNARG